DWIEQMLMFAQRKDVGAVGAKLYYDDDTIQHAGVIVGLGGVAGHSHKGFARDNPGYMARASIAQNLSACTAACLMIRKDVYNEVGGLDEGYAVAFNDIDFCMKIRDAGYLIVFTPFAEFYHYESKSRGDEDTPEKRARFNGEIFRFQERWGKELKAGDPYYNPNLTLDSEDFTLR
ncbi:MAG: glycosyltransferase family 2 protein, partial [Clostridia bacterium]|nr:glycosyltransferase family 2 protein [Clostridia bacterium]